jgi:hypothetical protein
LYGTPAADIRWYGIVPGVAENDVFIPEILRGGLGLANRFPQGNGKD